MKILMVSKDPTHPTTAGNRWGILKQAQMLSELGADVHFLYIQELPLKRSKRPVYFEDLDATREYWGSKLHVYKVPDMLKAWFNVLYRLRRWFFHSDCGVDDDYPCGLSAFVKNLHKEHHFDICIVNYYYLTKLLEKCDIRVKAVFTHDYFAYKNLVVGENILHINAGSEARAMQRAGHIFAVQDEEYAYYRLISPCSTVYNIYSLYEYHPQPIAGNHDIVFLSGGNQFNVNGISWFVESVFPKIRDKYSDARLLIGGAICSKLNDLKGVEGVTLVGLVDSPDDFYSRADIAINPVYQGTGLKIKTFESVSYSKCTIVHPHSSRGIFKPENAPVIVCESADEWVKALDSIWQVPGALEQIKAADREYIEEMSGFVRSEYLRFLKNAELR